MQRLISPPIEELDNLRQPLTAGERLVFNLFHETLAPEWEIYIQPHLNGLRPDFVLLNPGVGIAVFEVKDWDLNAMKYWTEERNGKPPNLCASKDNKSFSIQNQNPIEKIYQYKKEIYELYCPRLDERAGFATITAGVIFPFAKKEDVNRIFEPSLSYRGMIKYPRYNPIVGAESIAENKIIDVFPEGNRQSSMFMNDDKAADLRNWLIEPDFSKVQRKPIALDQTQKSFVNTRTDSGYRRIKGPAGSGKSLILAARAAQLIGQGKEVLVVTFNITLIHYLKDLAVRWPHSSGNIRSHGTWLNFHAWCKRVCVSSDHEKEYNSLWQGNNDESENQIILTEKLPSLVAKCIDGDSNNIIRRFDAVLVDEGQDFLPSWWNVLRKVCRRNGEMLLVADATQDVYGTANSWTDDAMVGAGFRGDWVNLRSCYRLPPTVMETARDFAEIYLPKETADLPIAPQAELDFFPCKLKWLQVSAEKSADECVKEILKMAPSVDDDILAITDITFLTSSQHVGLSVVEALHKKGVKTVHTFSTEKEKSRRKKVGFYMGDARVKATTLHSFKGWESRAIVLLIGGRVSEQSLALIYTGLTRLKRHEKGSFLTVVSCVRELEDFGKSWSKFELK